jgi:hypothetical protein
MDLEAFIATTSTLRKWWADYGCRPNRMTPYTSFGMTSPVGKPSVEAWAAFDAVLQANGYEAKSSWCYNCRKIKDSTKLSLHSYGIARDIDPFALGNPFVGGEFSWDKTKFNQQQIDAVYRITTNTGLQVFTWGGFWKAKKDYMHFQIDVKPTDLAVGIDWTTVGVPVPADLPAPVTHLDTLAMTPSHPDEEEKMATKLGDRDGDVGRLQDLLRQRGFDPGATDEKFGPKTKAALEAYQKTEGLTVTGIAGPSTWSILAAQVAQQ